MPINSKKNFCYRICHIRNLAHILAHGLCTKHHPDASAGFIGIGNPDIIDTRDDTAVKIAGYGNIGEYVPFYFTPKSMMLFNIITGWRAPLVPKRPKEDIIVIRCLITELAKLERFFFSDGQANVTGTSNHYNDIKYLDQIDWDIIQQSDFKREARDTDKPRRYQAEFLVHHHVPVGSIESIHVYNQPAMNYVKAELALTNHLIPIFETKQYFFD